MENVGRTGGRRTADGGFLALCTEHAGLTCTQCKVPAVRRLPSVGASAFAYAVPVSPRFPISLTAAATLSSPFHYSILDRAGCLAFRGHNESFDSKNQGNFLELLQFLAEHNEDISNVVLKNALENLKLTAPDIQKDICRAISIAITDYIKAEVGDSFFSILVDEARDVSGKEQMAVVIRYVNEKGLIIECFLGIVHVPETSARCLKKGVEQILSNYNLSHSKIRCQGYDGASNMSGEFNGLKALFLNDTNSAYYIHCFTHQLQLALVAVAKNHVHIALLFTIISNVMNIVGVSCKRRNQLRDKQHDMTLSALQKGEVFTGRGLNQEISLRRAGETRWGSHYESLIRLITMFSSVVDMLEIVLEDGISSEQRGEAFALLESMQSFDFSFCLHLMKDILGITAELSDALKRKDQDILNNRFTEANTELLLCIACLNPSNLFCAFNKEKLIKMANLYPSDFTPSDLMILDNQLETYIMDMRLDVQFSLLKDIGSLAEKMVQSRKEILYRLIFRLLKLALVLPVVTVGDERAFSAMAIIKNRLRNRIGDQWMNDTLIAYIEKENLDYIDNDAIIQLFQNMKNRRYKLLLVSVLHFKFSSLLLNQNF
ncbi:zinc finger MYM-type protein 1-like [Dendrobium catenatum]|uniref:zinc finger MYM-type protein 1-like n=1 Tax=Dendrobium catenatum TaxID=906689 RepID=UPI00109F1137|nr:zinc finger MYM-type protein 1-like [Dendrobium catenatum]